MFFTSIDTKIMLHRATDFAKDASALQKKSEITQSYLVKHMNEKTELEMTKIPDLHQKEENIIKRDKEQKNKNKEQTAEHAAKKPSEEEPEVGSSTSVIDIRI